MSSFEICAFNLFEGQLEGGRQRERARMCALSSAVPFPDAPCSQGWGRLNPGARTQSGSSKSMAETLVMESSPAAFQSVCGLEWRAWVELEPRGSDVGCGCPKSIITTRPNACPFSCLIILTDLIAFKSYDPCLGLMSVLMGYSNSFYLELNISDL